MITKNNGTDKNIVETIELMNRTLEVEYSCIVHFARLSDITKDEEIRSLITELGQDSVRHASVVADIISELGGIPLWSFEPFPEDMDLERIFQLQLEKEKLALQLHSQNAEVQVDNSFRNKLKGIAKDEEKHIQIVNNILSKLTENSEKQPGNEFF